MYLAAENGYEEVVMLLLAQKDIDVNKEQESGEWAGATPLIRASRNGHEEVVKLLLAHNDIYVNKGAIASTGGINTPLYYAVNGRWVEVVNLLLNHPQTDVNIGNDQANPLLRAVWLNFPEIVQILLQHPHIDVNCQRPADRATPLFLAAYYGRDSGITYCKMCIDLHSFTCIKSYRSICGTKKIGNGENDSCTP